MGFVGCDNYWYFDFSADFYVAGYNRGVCQGFVYCTGSFFVAELDTGFGLCAYSGGPGF